MRVASVSNSSPETTLHVYTRVSTAAQADQGTSLDSQIEIGSRKAKELGFKIEHWNEGGESSNHEEIEKRPKLFELYTLMRAGRVKHLWVYDQSRLSRNDRVASALRYECTKQGVTLYTKDGKYDLANPNDQFLKQMLDAVAQLDNAQRAERSRLGKIQRVTAGYWHGGPPPFGYALKDKRLEIEPVEAKWVNRIFKEASAGATSPEIKKLLDSNGVPARRGGLWTLGSIQALLRNPHYAGRYTYTDSKTKQQIAVDCPLIVAKETWGVVQASRRQDISRQSQKNGTHKNFYLLRDLMYCGHCGRPISGRIKPSKSEALYYCPNKERQWAVLGGSKEPWKRGAGCGFDRSMNLPQTYDLVWSFVNSMHKKSSLLKEEVKRRVLKAQGLAHVVDPEVAKRTAARVKKLQKELNNLSDVLGNLEAKFLIENSDPRAHKVTVERVLEAKDRIEHSLAEARQELRGESEKKAWVSWLDAFAEGIKPQDQMSDEDKQAYIKGLVERIDAMYLPQSREHELKIHFRLPIVGDGIKRNSPSIKGGGYSLVEGERDATLTIKKKDGRG